MKIAAALITIVFGGFLVGNIIAEAQESPRSFTDSGLSGRERSALERQQQFEIRNKSMLLNPRLAKPESSEEEKLYRYFGAASDLRESGRFEEALEILQYILDKSPDNDYVRAYLKRTQEEMQEQKGEWQIENEGKAIHLKEKKVENLLQDGTSYYEREDFDTALLKFSDVLAVDPDNSEAQLYMEKLKKYYFKEIKTQRLVGDKAADDPDKLIKTLLDKEDMKYVAFDKRVSKLLNQAELDTRIESTITLMREEEKRSRQLTLGASDVVRISVLDHPELSGDVTVQLKGEIILPLVNDLIIAQSLTMEELNEKVMEAMKRYVQNPRINTTIVEYRSKEFYVIDEISCTPFPITHANLTLRDALFISDWGENRALGRVIVMKPSKRGAIVKKIDAFDLIYRGNLENNIRIENGDVIYVPMTYASKITKSIADFLGPFRAMRTARDHYLNLRSNESDWKSTLSFRLPPNYTVQPEDSKDVRFDNDLNLNNVILRR